MEPIIRILHVEDDPAWRDIIRRLLGNEKGVELEQAATISEAHNLNLEHQFNIILADLNMSGITEQDIMTGLRNFERLMFEVAIDQGPRRLEERPRIVILTGIPATQKEITDTINTYPGWIWGWLEKSRFVGEDIKTVIAALQRHRRRTEKLVYVSAWPGGLVQLGAYLLSALVIWLVFFATNNTIFALLISVAPLGLVIAVQAYYLKMTKQLGDQTYKDVIGELIRQIFSWRP